MIKLTSGVNNITLIKNFNSIPTSIVLENLITHNTTSLDCTDIGTSKTKMTIEFSFFYPVSGEYSYVVYDELLNILSKGLALVKADDQIIINYEAEKTNIVYEGNV